MSEALLSRLPRFDAPLADAPAAVRLAQASGAPALPGVSEPAPEPVPSDLEVRASADAAAERALSEALASIGAAVVEMREANRVQTSAAIGMAASALFPKLSRLFLAEELARHLPALIPDAIASVEISAAPHLAKALSRASERIAPLPANVSIISAEHLRNGQVDVSWTAGGFDFDFDALLGKCLAQLNIRQTANKE